MVVVIIEKYTPSKGLFIRTSGELHRSKKPITYIVAAPELFTIVYSMRNVILDGAHIATGKHIPSSESLWIKKLDSVSLFSH